MSAGHLIELGNDITQLLRRAHRSDCRRFAHGAIALCGEPDLGLNFVVLRSGATPDELSQIMDIVLAPSIRVLVVVEEDAVDVLGYLAKIKIFSTGRLPLMERRATPVKHPLATEVRIASYEEWPALAPLMAASFVLNSASCDSAFPPTLAAEEGVEPWVFERFGKLLSCAVFVRDGDRAGLYAMATHPAWQRQGIGRALLNAAMQSLTLRGVQRFTVASTQKGLPSYLSEKFAIVARPHVLAIDSRSPMTQIRHGRYFR
ncbi:GNAT family N-acetyltransferase [Lysobacter enzymogenes]|uniref:GNAT family N-acetyltransferase n=1 Tax=Lysobacter enzymogenes TaxID=69 RepID=UPI0009D4238B|nr:GNAT family N-acetyltransferase [Lysobacter enzymogenes]QQQ00836.1 GNAT family N-acetyltransferase [Lysobacter enzymogenes]UZW61897.1 GNAT family N-acetyltransferase [Lysobacter enzymogenes]